MMFRIVLKKRNCKLIATGSMVVHRGDVDSIEDNLFLVIKDSILEHGFITCIRISDCVLAEIPLADVVEVHHGEAVQLG